MGDKSPKAKQKEQKQKVHAGTKGVAQAKAKQDSYSNLARTAGKGKK